MYRLHFSGRGKGEKDSSSPYSNQSPDHLRFLQGYKDGAKTQTRQRAHNAGTTPARRHYGQDAGATPTTEKTPAIARHHVQENICKAAFLAKSAGCQWHHEGHLLNGKRHHLGHGVDCDRTLPPPTLSLSMVLDGTADVARERPHLYNYSSACICVVQTVCSSGSPARTIYSYIGEPGEKKVVRNPSTTSAIPHLLAHPAFLSPYKLQNVMFRRPRTTCSPLGPALPPPE